MAEADSPTQAIDNLLDRILAADSVLVALRCDDVDALVDALRRIAQETGKALYVWRARVGLCRLPGRDETVPGIVHLADVLRFIERSPHFGVYFLADLPPALPARELAWGRSTGARRRLRHGAWVC